jgi:hypothetical protein
VCSVHLLHLSLFLTRLFCSSRLVQNIRLADESSNVGVLGKEWDLNIEEQEVEFRDDLRAASGIGKRRIKVSYCLVYSQDGRFYRFLP